MTIELVSYADLKVLLGLEEALITAYPDLALIQSSVTAAIEEYVGRSLESVERTENFFIGSEKSQMIGLKDLPVASVSSVTITIENEMKILKMMIIISLNMVSSFCQDIEIARSLLFIPGA